MPNFTENYNLEKPTENEKYNINVFNSNADIIDSALANKLNADSADNFAKETSVQNLISKVGNFEDDADTANSVFAKLNTIQNNFNKNDETLSFPAYKEISLQPQKGTVNVFNIQGCGKLNCFYFSLCPGSYKDTGTFVTAKLIIDDATIFNITATRTDPGTSSGGAYSAFGNFFALDAFYFSYRSSTACYVLKGTTKLYNIYSEPLTWKGEINAPVGAHDGQKSYGLVSDKSPTFKNRVIVSITSSVSIASDVPATSINIGYTLD